MNPEKPSSVPAMIRTLFPSTNPVAAEARPAYEFNSDITTGMSAEPIGSTSRTPNSKGEPEHDVKRNRPPSAQRSDK